VCPCVHVHQTSKAGVCARLCMFLFCFVRACTCVLHKHIYIHTHIHTYTHTHRSILVDTSITPTMIYIAGNFRGTRPRFYIPDLTTRKPRRGPEYKEGEDCCSNNSATNLTSTPPEKCWYVCGEGIRTLGPIDMNSPLQSGKWGVFVAAYDTSGVVRSVQNGMYLCM
jgi:hypothetical protein